MHSYTCEHFMKPKTNKHIGNSHLNRPEGFMVCSLPSGEQQTHYLLNIISGPKNEVHLLCATDYIL